MPKPFPAELRRDVVAVARKHESTKARSPTSQIAKGERGRIPRPRISAPTPVPGNPWRCGRRPPPVVADVAQDDLTHENLTGNE